MRAHIPIVIIFLVFFVYNSNNTIRAELDETENSEQNITDIANFEEFDHESDTPSFALVGYASLSGDGLETTTGGAGGEVDTITTLEQLLQMASGRENDTTPAI
jgi:pectate lyase